MNSKNPIAAGLIAAGLGLSAVLVPVGTADAEPLGDADLAVGELMEMSLEDLMEVEITSAAKKSQRLADVPAAVFVLTDQEIRRSGVTNVPDALRLVPGVQVARIDNSQWAVSVRGFQGLFANKLLVMIDGRSVYSPLFSGVHWNLHDVMLDDVDRIEVIRGPGASVWGANAVNGVINIITKSAWDTQGELATLRGGTREDFGGAGRHGGQIGDHFAYRLYTQADTRGRQSDFNDIPADDAMRNQRGGFRIDGAPSARDQVTIQGDVFAHQGDETKVAYSLAPPFAEPFGSDGKAWGANVLGRWTRRLDEGQELELQTYYDRTDWDNGIYENAEVTVDTFDIEANHRLRLGGDHDVVWGVGYRLNAIDTGSGDNITFDQDRRDQLLSAFVQDEITLIDDRLRLTAGTKLEHNGYTGFELQPTARLLATPHPDHTLWFAVSRAVRTPSPVETDVNALLSVIPPSPEVPLPTQIDLVPNEDINAEELIAFEFGYRMQPRDTLNVDLAAFYNLYDDLVATRLVATSPLGFPPTGLISDQQLANVVEAETYGFEVSTEYQVLPWWRLRTGYSLLFIDARAKTPDAAAIAAAEAVEEGTPRQQTILRSSIDLSEHVELDLTARHVDNIASLDISAYTMFDARIGWRPRDDIELALVGQNLFDDQHPESQSEALSTVATEVPRAIFGRLTVRF